MAPRQYANLASSLSWVAGFFRRSQMRMLILAIVLLDIVILWAVLFRLLERQGILTDETSYLKWAYYYLVEIPLVFGIGRCECRLPALVLASSQVGLLAIWVCLGKSPATYRWFIAITVIWLWSNALSFVHGWGIPASKSGGLFVAEFICVCGFCFVFRFFGFDLKSTHNGDKTRSKYGRRWQYTISDLLMVTTLTAFFLGIYSYLEFDSWSILEGLGCAISTVVALAVVFVGKWWLRVLLLLSIPILGFSLMWIFDYQHHWWGPGSYLPQHYAFDFYYLPYIFWMPVHAILVILPLLILRLQEYQIPSVQPLTSCER